MKKIAILQSNYIPWKGYFDLIAAVDEFILYDDVQFTKNDWRNRNKIKTPKGEEWLTVPVGKHIHRRIRDVIITNDSWQKKHWHTLESNYQRSPHFNDIAVWLEPIYLEQTHKLLCALNRTLIVAICDYLKIDTRIVNSWDYRLIEGKTERLVDLCRQAGCTQYVSGPSAKDYIEERHFIESGIKLTWFDYEGYLEYSQQWGGFLHNVTILDLLFNCGKESPKFMKHVVKS